MTDKHIKVFRFISTYTLEQSKVGWAKFSQFEIDKIGEFLETNCSNRHEFQFDGKVCNWGKEGYDYDIFFVTERDIRQIEEWDKIIHEGIEGKTTIEDITEDVLYDRLDTSVFGFYELEMREIFYEYRVEYLTNDDILDKMLKYGKESLTENDKLFLDNKEMISPLDSL